MDYLEVIASMVNGIDEEIERTLDGMDTENVPALESLWRIKRRFCIGAECLKAHQEGGNG